MKLVRCKKTVLMCGAGLLVLASPALAHSNSDASSASQAGNTVASNDDRSSQEIVVTAQRRAERLIDTPQSVTAVTAEDLFRLNATQFVDYANTIPGLQFSTLGVGRTSINLRGVTTGTDVSQTVGIYVDDVPYGSSTIFAVGSQFTLDAGLYDLDRVEVLRGPQGTLYGASSMGGVLKYVTREPSLTEFGGTAQGGVATTRHGDASYNGNLVANVPIVTDKVAVRASGYYSKSGGYIDNIATGEKDVDAGAVYGGRIDILLKPADDLTVRLTGYGQNINRDGSLYADYDRFTRRPINGSLEQSHILREPFDSKFRLASGTLSYDFGPASLTSITSYQTIKTSAAQDISLLFGPLAGLFGATGAETVTEVSTNKFTQEVRLASEGGKVIDWIVGGFYTYEDSEVVQSLPLYDAALNVVPITLSDLTIPSTYKEIAAFGNLTWHLTDRFDITGGIRYAHNRQTYEQIGAGLLATSVPEIKSKEGVFTYLANARYRFNRNVMAYARFATGYRPGGPNTVVLDPVTGAPLSPAKVQADTLKSYEVGLKAQTSDRSFAIDASIFYIDWNNIQVGTARGGFAAYFNASGAHIKGAELTLTARPTSGLTFTGAFAYNDAYITEADADLGAAKGERLPNTARFTGTINGDYVLEASPFKPTIGATLRLVGDRTVSFDASALPNYRLPDYVTADIRAGATIGPVEAQVYVRNLFDARAQLSASTVATGALGGAQVAIAQPRTIGISATTRF